MSDLQTEIHYRALLSEDGRACKLGRHSCTDMSTVTMAGTSLLCADGRVIHGAGHAVSHNADDVFERAFPGLSASVGVLRGIGVRP